MNTSIRQLGQLVAREWRARRGIHQMNRLNDRMLADIGISRSEIQSAARGTISPVQRQSW